jgi:hypothetical protein
VHSIALRFITAVQPIFRIFSKTSANFLHRFLILNELLHDTYLTTRIVDALSRFILQDIRRHGITFLVGHGFSGLIMKLVSEKTGLPSVAIGAPCVEGESRLIGESAQRQAMVQEILPLRDIAALALDRKTALYRIPCDGGMLRCNNVMQTLCMTAVMCGEGASVRQLCEAEFGRIGFAAMGRYFHAP